MYITQLTHKLVVVGHIAEPGTILSCHAHCHVASLGDTGDVVSRCPSVWSGDRGEALRGARNPIEQDIVLYWGHYFRVNGRGLEMEGGGRREREDDGEEAMAGKRNH